MGCTGGDHPEIIGEVVFEQSKVVSFYLVVMDSLNKPIRVVIEVVSDILIAAPIERGKLLS